MSYSPAFSNWPPLRARTLGSVAKQSESEPSNEISDPFPSITSARTTSNEIHVPDVPVMKMDPAVPIVSSLSLNVAQVLVFALIEKTPDVVGGSARIVRTRIPVWTIENYRRLGASEDEILEAFPNLRPADVRAARAYVALHADEVERDIAENDPA